MYFSGQIIAGVPQSPAGDLGVDRKPSHAKACVENFKQQSSPRKGYAISGYYLRRVFIFTRRILGEFVGVARFMQKRRSALVPCRRKEG